MNNGLLLDTNIISRFSPDRKEKSSEGLRKWLHIRAEAGTLYLSAITISEIERGMRKLHRSGGMKRAKLMNDWLESLTENFGDRVLPVDCVVARIAGAMEDDAKAKGRHQRLGLITARQISSAVAADFGAIEKRGKLDLQLELIVGAARRLVGQ